MRDEREFGAAVAKQVLRGGKRRSVSKRGIHREKESNSEVRLQQRCPLINSVERIPMEPLGWLEFL